ncbi:Hpt domain-containing response regulator [Yunchengibacter salinarum]|uniref:Hpt domain-containing response regulator n=1 Tax=Yunchengibacter salinarum TaxID=3133399 RepID=UPI0035B64540
MRPDEATILLVEDDPVTRRVLVDMLRPLGRVLLAKSGRQALDRVGSTAVDVVLTDFSMADLDGPGLARAIRAEKALARLPIIGMSGRDTAAERATCRSAGMDAFLPKPVTADSLVETLTRLFPGGFAERRKNAIKMAEGGTGQAALVREGEAIGVRIGPLIDLFDGLEGPLQEVLAEFLETHGAGAARIAAFAPDTAPMDGEGGWAALVHDAHQVRGACRSLNADRVRDLAAELEKAGDAAMQGRPVDHAAFARLQSAYAREFARMADFFQRLIDY